MTSTAALPQFALETSGALFALLRKVDPASFRDESAAEARADLERIRSRVHRLLDEAKQDRPTGPLAVKVADLAEVLDRAQPRPDEPPRSFWASFIKDVHPAYEALASWLRSESLPANSLRPTNYTRNLFHIGSATLALLVLLVLPTMGWVLLASGVLCATAWTLEITRRTRPALNDRLMAFFGKVAHAHERHRVNSSTWYLTALVLLSLFASRGVAAVAVVVLGLADPMAAIVGRRFGRTKLRAGRSLEGTLTFFAVAALAAFVVASLLIPGGLLLHVGVAIVAGGSGALVELFSTKLDDNLTIPVGVAAAVGTLLAIVTRLAG